MKNVNLQIAFSSATRKATSCAANVDSYSIVISLTSVQNGETSVMAIKVELIREEEEE